jgi:hypothetical protein
MTQQSSYRQWIRMGAFVLVLMALAILAFVAPTPLKADSNTTQATYEKLVFDWNKLVTVEHRGFPYNQGSTMLANGNWVTPINFAGGTFYYRVELRKMPSYKDVRFQFCVWQDKFRLENCGSQKQVSYRGTKIVATWSQGVPYMWKKDGKSIDWSRPRYRQGFAIKNSKGLPVSNYNGWNWNGENPAKWYPMNVRLTVVVVAKGKTFSGWGNYIK